MYDLWGAVQIHDLANARSREVRPREQKVSVELRLIDTLPVGEGEKRSPIDGSLISVKKMTGRSRLSRFPHECRADVTAILGVIFMMALVDSKKIIKVTATPKKKNPQYNFHKWLCVEGVGIDLTIGQFYPQDDSLLPFANYECPEADLSNNFIIRAVHKL